MSGSLQHSFNLVEEGWLPVTLLDQGAMPETWNLREFFRRAHEARGLNEPSPLTYTAVMRFLLAITHRAVNGPRSPHRWAELWRKGEFDQATFDAYLDTWKHRFDLFDADAPFAQTRDMPPDKTSPGTRLFMERSSGNNNIHFDHSSDEASSPIPAGEAARALLTAHAYAFAGTGGMFMQSPMVAGYAVSFEGDNLFETIMLNLVLYHDEAPTTLTAADDAPWWERGDVEVPRKVFARPRGLTDLYTWRSRRLRLIPDNDGSVNSVQYEQGLVVEDTTLSIRDPWKRYAESKGASGTTAFFPANYVMGKALWRDSAALLETARNTAEPSSSNEAPTILTNLATLEWELEGEIEQLQPNIIATGLVNNQARIDLWRMDRMSIPAKILADRARMEAIRRAVGATETAAWVLQQAGRKFCEVGLSDDADDVKHIQKQLQLRERFWARMDREFQQFLSGLGDEDFDPTRTREVWESDIRRLVRTIFVAATNTIAGHRWYAAQVEAGRLLDNMLNKQLPEPEFVASQGKEVSV